MRLRHDIQDSISDRDVARKTVVGLSGRLSALHALSAPIPTTAIQYRPRSVMILVEANSVCFCRKSVMKHETGESKVLALVSMSPRRQFGALILSQYFMTINSGLRSKA